MSSVDRKAMESRLEQLFADLFRLSDSELRSVRLVWESEDQPARRRAWENARAAIDRERRMDIVDEAQSAITRWLGSYLSATTAEYGGFLTGASSGMDAGEVRRGAIPPLMDAVVAIIAADALDADDQELLLNPMTEVISQHGRPGV